MKVLFKLGIMMSIVAGFFCFSSCGYQSPYYIKLAHEITAKTGEKLEKEKGLLLVGTGGQMMNDIQMMMMGFFFYRVVDIETARQLLARLCTFFVSRIQRRRLSG